MKDLEIIRLIFEEKNNIEDIDLFNFANNDVIYSLSILCSLNRKYLTEDNFNSIVNNTSKSSIEDHHSALSLLIKTYPDILNDKIKNILNVDDWVKIIKVNPQLIDDCNITNKFNEYDWIEIIKEQPQLNSRVENFYRQVRHYKLYHEINHSKLIKYINFDFNQLKVDSLNYAVSASPEIIKKLNDDNLRKIKLSTWVDIIENEYELIKYCKIPNIDKYLQNNIDIIIKIVSNQPKYINLLPSVNQIENIYLSELVSKQPNLIEKLNINIKKFNRDDWFIILQNQPQLIDKCNKFNELNINQWFNILIKQPKLIDYCNCYNKFYEHNWYDLLMKYPYLINKCNKYLFTQHKIQLLMLHPKLIENIPVNEISNIHFEYILYNSREYHLTFMKKYIKKK